MKTLTVALVLIGLLLIVMATSRHGKRSSGKPDRAASSLFIKKLLQAHNIPQGWDAPGATVVEAGKAYYDADDRQGDAPNPYDLQIKVCFNGTNIRREKHSPQERTRQVDLFDGQTVYRAAILHGETTSSVRHLEDWEIEDVKFGVLTCGILPLIKQLQDSSVETVYIGSADNDPEKLVAKIASVDWTIYVDEQHLIRKVEMVHRGHSEVIMYDEYKMVGGINLPFRQLFYADGKPKYELAFTRVEFNALLPSGYFTLDALRRGSFD